MASRSCSTPQKKKPRCNGEGVLNVPQELQRCQAATPPKDNLGCNKDQDLARRSRSSRICSRAGLHPPIKPQVQWEKCCRAAAAMGHGPKFHPIAMGRGWGVLNVPQELQTPPRIIWGATRTRTLHGAPRARGNWSSGIGAAQPQKIFWGAAGTRTLHSAPGAAAERGHGPECHRRAPGAATSPGRIWDTTGPGRVRGRGRRPVPELQQGRGRAGTQGLSPRWWGQGLVPGPPPCWWPMSWVTK